MYPQNSSYSLKTADQVLNKFRLVQKSSDQLKKIL